MMRANKFHGLQGMAKEKEPKKIELTDAEVTSLRERIKNRKMTDEDFVLFEQVLLFMLWIQRQLERFKLTTNKLRRIIFGSKTEKGSRSRSKCDNVASGSLPVMDALKKWMQSQFDERKVEPNSALGGAIRYMKKHWAELTRFLSVSGAHIDNNLVERALKLAIRTRKNAMFHKSLHGAFVAGLLLSLIATCELAGKNPVRYLIALQEHKSDVFKHPDWWLPWNYDLELYICA